MPTTSQFHNVFRINKPDAGNISTGGSGYASKIRRNRQPLSCDACRTRKLKCDRQLPCAPCSKRGEASLNSCSYSRNSRDGGIPSEKATTSTKSEAQLRLQKLEEMVTNLMQASTSSISKSSSLQSTNVDQRMQELSVSIQGSSKVADSPSNGHLDNNGSERTYQGATHWTTILNNIHDIQGFLASNTYISNETVAPNPPKDPDIVFETAEVLSRNDVQNALPSRPVADRLISVYFSTRYLQAPMIHSHKFLRDYRAFWADPLSTSFLWIAILFCILWTSSHIEASEVGESSLENPYLRLAAQALVAGDYQKARPYSVDATTLYAMCIYHRSREDNNKDAWMTMGLATRLAMKMGYHRDPNHLANITPFEGEIRRRCFFLLDTFDTLLSVQHGLPAIMQEEECDTEPPRNLLDDDFDEACETLPPSRPTITASPMLYFCYKSRLVKAHKRVIRHALTVKSKSYEETLKLDAELQANDVNTPPSLQLTSLDDLLLDNAYQIMRRMHIKFQYLQSLCMLHRKYLTHDRTNPAFAYSRTTCANAALQLLKHQADLHFASQPGGRFANNKSMEALQTQHHFLVAAMIICLDMYETHSKFLLLSQEDLEGQVKKYDALRIADEIWISQKTVSRDAQRASSILAFMLSRVPRPKITAKNTNDTLRNHPALPQYSSDTVLLETPMKRTMGGFSWYSNVPSTNNQDDTLENYPVLQLDATDPLNTIFDGSEDVDWDVLDKYLVEGFGDLEAAVNWQKSDF